MLERRVHVCEDNESSCHVCSAPSGTNHIPLVRVPPVILKLQKEHESILQQSRTLLSARGKTRMVRSMASMQLARLERLVTQHQKEEERILIPIVDRYLDSHASKSIHREHLEMVKTLRQVRARLTQVGVSDQPKSLEAFFKSAAVFDSVAREHFLHEENVIFWFATICITKSGVKLQSKRKKLTRTSIRREAVEIAK